jgi:polyhydroxybutyrate depolymerase
MLRWIWAGVGAFVLISCSSALVGGPPAQGQPAALNEGHLRVNGVDRTYHLHVPPAAKGKKSPLLMVFHGGEGDGTKIARQTGFNRVADRWGVIVVYPDSLEYWNDGRSTIGTPRDDVGFVRQLIKHLVETENVDPQRVYATGASNGGNFTLRLACEMSTEIAAFAPVVASFPAEYWPRCKPQRPVPILMINGTSDTFIPWEGGAMRRGFRRGAGGEVVPVPTTLDFWAKNNACSPKPTVEKLPDRDRGDGTTVQVITYSNCRDASSVRMIRVDGGGHTWPGSEARAARLMGNTTRDIDASDEIWNFFKERRLS